MTKTMKKHSALIHALLFTGIYYLIIYVIASLPISFWQSLHLYSSGNAIAFINQIFIICHCIVLCCALFLFRKTLKNDAQLLMQHKGKTLLLWVIGLIAIIISGFLFIHGTSDNENALNIMMSNISAKQLLIFQLIVIFVGPLNEEMMFREVIIGQLSRYLPKTLLLILSSAFFAYLHIPSLSAWPQAIPYFANGLILGIVYIKGGNNVLASYGLHVINNLLSSLL